MGQRAEPGVRVREESIWKGRVCMVCWSLYDGGGGASAVSCRNSSGVKKTFVQSRMASEMGDWLYMGSCSNKRYYG